MHYVLQIDRALGEIEQVPCELTDYTLHIHDHTAGKTWGPKPFTLNPAELLADGQAARKDGNAAMRLGNALRTCLQPTD